MEKMTWEYKQILKDLSDNIKLLKNSKHGLEREALRITNRGKLSPTPHPKTLGSALTNYYITTDFSEAQLELITPALSSEEKAIKFLEDVHIFVAKNLNKDEFLWPFSMPCRLPKDKKIPIAYFGTSKQARKKHLYRLGLSERYGKKMQTISGTHYNFSFSKELWTHLHKKYNPFKDKQKFISESYLHIIRNFLRFGWLNTYLFGASPAIDKTYCQRGRKLLKKLNRNTCYGEFATSLRMSQVGYYSKGQAQIAISFNSPEEYLRDIKYAILTPFEKYRGLKGLNENILQIENEHYARIRPKQPPKENETYIEAIEKRGIKYIEVRSVDINPSSETGLIKNQLRFLHAFLIYCLFKDSPPLSEKEQEELVGNQDKAALYGRKKGLLLHKKGKSIEMLKWGNIILTEMKPIVSLLDKTFKTTKYTDSLNYQFKKIEDVNTTASAEILNRMKKNKCTFQKCGEEIGKKYKKNLLKKTLNKTQEERFKKAVEKSIEKQERLEILDTIYLEGFEDMEISTQMVIREALKRGVRVEVLDRNDNFIRLSKGGKVKYVKQATKTDKDSYMTFLIMENKEVSKIVLKEGGLTVPEGKLFQNTEEALKNYEVFRNKKIIVKPTHTNYGIGISAVGKNDQKSYEKAIKNAFKHGESIIVEEFINGKEYRFLTMGKEVMGVLNRIPANVEGDGKNTIRRLVKMKNLSPYKFCKIRLSEIEKTKLKSQGLTAKSIPKKGRIIYLRDESNCSIGGDPVDVTDEVRKDYKKIAVKAAKIAKAEFCGLDIIIEDIKKPATKNNYSIIEINFNPGMLIHKYPAKGKSRPIEKKVLDILGF